MDIQQFKQWVYKEFKIDLSAYKELQLNRRIVSLMNRNGYKTFDEYISALKVDKELRQKFLDYITINVTEFFRNPDIFDGFNTELSKIIHNTTGQIKIWSAACSIGAEPYSIAILMDKLGALSRTKIMATDIDLTILNRAQKGEFSEQEIKNISSSDLNKYFLKSNDKYNVKDSIKKVITFKRHDLIIDDYENNFDAIVCRNVVIYFNSDVKDKIYEKFSKSLKKDGVFFVGATESIYNYKDYNFEKASTFIYKKR